LRIKGQKAKQPYAIAMKDGKPFGIGGIWENWKDPATGDWVRTFAVITTDANTLVADIHDRMPLILASQDCLRWLGDEPDPADLMRPFPAEPMRMWAISTRVNKPENDAPDANWLVKEMPSPPIHKMLRTYIPKLHLHQGKPLADWQKLAPLFKAIGELAEDRNVLTHTGEMTARASDNLPVTLKVISDLLYILDVLEGHEWAKGNVQHSTRLKLGWPKPRRDRLCVKVDVRAV
jgi:SOS response associated peptidase (SRAP)